MNREILTRILPHTLKRNLGMIISLCGILKLPVHAGARKHGILGSASCSVVQIAAAEKEFHQAAHGNFNHTHTAILPQGPFRHAKRDRGKSLGLPLSLPKFRMIRSDSHLSAVQELLEALVIAVIGYCKTTSEIQSHHAKKRFGIHNVAAVTVIGNVNVKITVLCSVYKVLNITGVQINILGCSHRIPPSSQKARPFFVLFL